MMVDLQVDPLDANCVKCRNGNSSSGHRASAGLQRREQDDGRLPSCLGWVFRLLLRTDYYNPADFHLREDIHAFGHQ
ncbi:hypothetical protein [Rhodopila sp.]|uniref:hypothetical protein n=1 Tax=Rhodopila sp. TaxID=2480087 RepID=UPI003D14C23F